MPSASIRDIIALTHFTVVIVSDKKKLICFISDRQVMINME